MDREAIRASVASYLAGDAGGAVTGGGDGDADATGNGGELLAGFSAGGVPELTRLRISTGVALSFGLEGETLAEPGDAGTDASDVKAVFAAVISSGDAGAPALRLAISRGSEPAVVPDGGTEAGEGTVAAVVGGATDGGAGTAIEG